jgi:hypothetical protein
MIDLLEAYNKEQEPRLTPHPASTWADKFQQASMGRLGGENPFTPWTEQVGALLGSLQPDWLQDGGPWGDDSVAGDFLRPLLKSSMPSFKI